MSSEKPTAILMCGLPGAGKTTVSKQLEHERGAIRLCTDDWLADIGADFLDEKTRNKMESRLWKLSKQLLQVGQTVIFEKGHWLKEERVADLAEVRELGAEVELHYFDVPFDELLRRVAARNLTGAYGTTGITEEEMRRYAGLFQPPDDAELALFDTVVIHRPE